MASFGSTSPLKGPPIEPLELIINNALLVTEDETDMDIPMLTDEDIDCIVQDINYKEPPNISMSLVEDNGVNEIEKPVQQTHDPIIDAPTADQTSAIDNKEIDVIQKHVEESLLFLDHEKANVKVAEILEEKKDCEPINEVVWETAKSTEKCEHESDVLDKIDDHGSISLEPSVTLPQDDVDGNAILVDQENATVIPEKEDETIENNFQESTLLPAQENVKEPNLPLKLANTTTEAHSKMDEDEENKAHDLNPTPIVSEDCVLPVEYHTQEEKVISDTIEENENIGNLNPLKESILPAENIQKETEVLEDVKQNDNTENLDILPVEQAQKEVECLGNGNDTSVDSEQCEKMVLLVEHAQNENEFPDNVVCSKQSEESILPVEGTQNEADVTDSVEHIDNTVNLEQSAENILPIENTLNGTEASDNVNATTDNSFNSKESNVEDMTHKEDISAEKIHNNVNADLTKENFLDSPLPEHQITEKQDELVTPIHESADKSLLNSDQNETNEVVEKMDETDDSNVQLEPQNTTIQVVAESNPSSDHAQNKVNEDSGAFDKPNEQQESQVSEEILKPEDGKGLKDVIDNPNSEENVEKVNESVQTDQLESQINEMSVQKSIISSTPSEGIKDIEETTLDKETIVEKEPSQIENEKDENQIPMEFNEKPAASNRDENVPQIEPRITSTQESVFECPIENIKLEPNIEIMDVDEDIPAKTLPAQITMNQEDVDMTPLLIVDKEPEIKKESDDGNVNSRQEIVFEESTESTSSNCKLEVSKPNSVKPDSIIQTKSSNIATKPQEVKTSAIKDQITKAPEKSNKNLVYNINSAHSAAFIDVTKQTPIGSETVSILIPQSSLVKFPLQKSTKISIPQKNDNFSKNSGKSKVSNEAEYPPAKRSRVEPVWSTASPQTIDSSTLSRKTPSPVIHTQSVIESTKDSDTEIPEPSDGPVQRDTCSEANRPQSSCSFVVDETPMDFNDEDLQAPDTTPFTPAQVDELAQWCHKHRVIKGFQSQAYEMPPKVLRRSSKFNKGVLRLGNIPKSFNQADVHFLIKKYTSDAGKEISKKISFIFIDKTTNPLHNTAFIKWKNEDRILVSKALLILRQAGLNLEGKRLMIDYDNRSVINWNTKERPILSLVKNNSLSPFTTGEIDGKNTQTYGLQKEFLDRYNIKLPLTNVVTVENVDNQVSEGNLRIIFNNAGCVKSFKMNRKDKTFELSIEYDHALEAVQAISMFHEQQFYNRVLKVTMDNTAVTNPNNSELPEGLPNIGPGLGFAGKPLRGVRMLMEMRRLKNTLYNNITKIKQSIHSSHSQLKEALNNQKVLEKKIQRQNKEIQKYQDSLQEAAVAQPNLQQNPQPTISELSTAIASSIQTNFMSLIGGLPPQNFPQSVPNQVAQSAVSPAWVTATETPSWAPPNAQYNFTPMQPQAYPPTNLINMQTGLATMSNPCAQQIPNLQAGSQASPLLSMQTGPSMQKGPRMQTLPNMNPVAVGIQQEYIHEYPVPSTMPTNTQSVFPRHTPTTVAFPSASVASNPVVYPPVPVKNPVVYPPIPVTKPAVYPPVPLTKPITATSRSNVRSRFDIPHLVIPPPNLGQIQKAAVPPLPPAKSTELTLGIPFPKTKPQNRAPTKPIATVKTAPVVKPPNPAGIKFNLASLQLPGINKLNFESIPPPPKLNSSTSPSKEPYSKASKALKRKSPVKERLINKQTKATRRSSKSPESSRTRSPRRDRSKESRRSRERNYSRERDTDYKRSSQTTTVVFKHLPSSVKRDDLREKMQEIGKLLLVQVSGAGNALVKFRSRRGAERCIEMYNQAKVDGQTIEVKWYK